MLLGEPSDSSPYANFMEFSDHLFARHGKQHGISPDHLGEAIHHLLVSREISPTAVIEALESDHRAMGSRNPPLYLTRLKTSTASTSPPTPTTGLQRRQQRHLGQTSTEP